MKWSDLIAAWIIAAVTVPPFVAGVRGLRRLKNAEQAQP